MSAASVETERTIQLERPPDDWLIGPSDLRLSVLRRRALVGSRELPLTKTTFDVLAVLLRRRGEVVPVEELIREVWGYDSAGHLGFARTAIYRLRKELKSAGIDDPIEAIRGVGFRIADEGDRVAVAFDPESALMSATTAIFVVSPERRVIWANPAAERLSGYTLAELRALPSTQPLLGGGGPPVYDPMRREVVSGRVLQGMARLRIKDGSELEVPASWKPVFDASGELLYTITEFWPALSHASVSQAG